MIGSIIGDIVGSIYEFHNIKTKNFEFFNGRGSYTDDSILTLATADWILNGGDVAHYYSKYAIDYPLPMGGYGSRFLEWVNTTRWEKKFYPYNSCGNGSAMRVGPVGWAFDNVKEVLVKAKESAECTHDHPEGIKGAQATSLCIFMARTGASKDEIRKEIEKRFQYNLHFTCDEIRPSYRWGATCQDSVPQAIVAFLDGKDYEDSVRNAISIGGDSDTIGCITGSIAEAFFGVPQDIRDQGMSYLPYKFKQLVLSFEEKFPCNKEVKKEKNGFFQKWFK